jgi:hypothetical protein
VTDRSVAPGVAERVVAIIEPGVAVLVRTMVGMLAVLGVLAVLTVLTVFAEFAVGGAGVGATGRSVPT